MTKLTILLFLIFSLVVACGQNNHSDKKTLKKENEPVSYDTSRIVILPIDTTNQWVFKDAMPMQLTNQDFQRVDSLLQQCLKVHNAMQDTTQGLSEYIDLKKYKLQYIPFLDEKGQKKVYINSFCDVHWSFKNYWKQSLVVANGGGSCFFKVTINLTENTFEQIVTNGIL